MSFSTPSMKGETSNVQQTHLGHLLLPKMNAPYCQSMANVPNTQQLFSTAHLQSPWNCGPVQTSLTSYGWNNTMQPVDIEVIPENTTTTNSAPETAKIAWKSAEELADALFPHAMDTSHAQLVHDGLLNHREALLTITDATGALQRNVSAYKNETNAQLQGLAIKHKIISSEQQQESLFVKSLMKTHEQKMAFCEAQMAKYTRTLQELQMKQNSASRPSEHLEQMADMKKTLSILQQKYDKLSAESSAHEHRLNDHHKVFEQHRDQMHSLKLTHSGQHAVLSSIQQQYADKKLQHMEQQSAITSLQSDMHKLTQRQDNARTNMRELHERVLVQETNAEPFRDVHSTHVKFAAQAPRAISLMPPRR